MKHMHDILNTIRREMLATTDRHIEALLGDLRRVLLDSTGLERCPTGMQKARYDAVRGAAVVLARGDSAVVVIAQLIWREDQERALRRDGASAEWQSHLHNHVSAEVEIDDDERDTYRPNAALSFRQAT